MTIYYVGFAFLQGPLYFLKKILERLDLGYFFVVVYHPFPNITWALAVSGPLGLLHFVRTNFVRCTGNLGKHIFSQAGFHQLCWLRDGICHLSNVQNPVDIPLYWLVDRDPYNGLS